ncbi:MAG: nickel pincer cofactor biosynthesis protein LarC [Candidatus Omnitrophota bacterium]|nr:nickel pincer cofactor biosynthesis protein LarC [Candidatus Omnitrophota bacterium]
MKIVYFDLLGGMSGDMTLAAFLDAGLSFDYLKKELNKLKIKGFELKKSYVERRHFKAVNLSVLELDSKIRSPRQILNIIDKSSLKGKVKDTAKAIYNTLVLAEAKVHRQKKHCVEFEELGKIDSLVDIAGAAIAIDYFKAEKYLVSDIPVSKLVGPATLELLKGFKIKPVNYDYETVTPTGAAILKTIRAAPVSLKDLSFTLEKTGLGAGTFNPAYVSNVLKIISGLSQDIYAEDEIMIIEANIDDMNPQHFEYLEEELLRAGVLDVYVQAVKMKKSRPGFLLTVLTAFNLFDKVVRIIFKETTTFGIRYFPAKRKKIIRELKSIKTRIGSCRVKIGSLNSSVRTLSPEYEDCKRLARKSGLALRQVYDQVKKEGLKRWPYPV